MARSKHPDPDTLTARSDTASLTRGELAYQQLRQSIQEGQLQPGTRLREADLAERLGISRTPVREALSRLEAEGLIGTEAGKGLVVTTLDHSMVSELYVMREVLEGTAASLAARHASDVEISMLREIADHDRALLSDPEKLAANNRFFHEMLYRSAHNRYLLKTLNSLQESMTLLGRTTLATGNRGETSMQEHQVLVDALERRDSVAAENIARAHIRAAYKTRLSVLLGK